MADADLGLNASKLPNGGSENNNNGHKSEYFPKKPITHKGLVLPSVAENIPCTIFI